MEPKTYWKIGLILLVLLTILHVISVYLAFANPYSALLNSILILLILLFPVVVSLILFVLKNHIAFNLTRVVAIFQVIIGILVILLSLLGFQLETFLFGSFLILIGTIIFFCTQKSKSIFEKMQ